MSAKKTSVQIFIAYSQKDRVFLDALRSHASPLLRKGNVTIWFDGEIRAGEQWGDVIKANLHAADIIVMLLSSNALSSDYFYEQELEDAVARHKAGTAKVVPVVLSACLWQETPLADIQGLPRGMKPINNWRNWDDAWNEVVLGLRDLILEIEQGTSEIPAVETPTPIDTAAPAAKSASAAEAHAWEFTTDTHTRVAYQKYLDRFPQGFYADAARGYLAEYDADDTAWEFANDTGTDQAMQKYLKKYPKGQYAAIARGRIDPFYDLMVPVKGGTFGMGDVFEEGYDREKPVHKVTLDDFWMCKYPVTQGLWKAVMGKDNNPSRFTGDDMLPVEQVSWDMAQEFIAVLNKKSGLQYSLPTEAQWEYAAREGGKKIRFGNGKNTADPAEMNFDASKGNKQLYSLVGEYRKKTTPVNLFKPNALGLYDMSGNVWEWCAEWYGEQYYQECAGHGIVKNPTGPVEGAFRVFRGGSWIDGAQGCRSAYRDYYAPDYRYSYFGFRLVLFSFPV